MSEPASAAEKPRKAFVTGGTGFIGSHLVEALLHRGFEVHCLVRTRRKWLDGLPIVPVVSELEDSPAVRDALEGADVVYHVAGVTRATDWATFEKANVEAPLLLLDLVGELAPDVSRVVITSSLAAVGACPTGIADEKTPLHPVSAYGRSKALMEEAVQRRRNEADFPPFTIIRPPSVYGPREADIYTFFQTVSRGIVPVVGSGSEPAVTLVHVRDLVKGMIAAAESDAAIGGTYFLGTDHPHSWNEIRDVATGVLGRKAVTVRVPERLILPVGAIAELAGRLTGSYPPLNREKAREIRHACKMCSSGKASRDFGYRAEVGLEEGIRETIRWYQQEGWL